MASKQVLDKSLQAPKLPPILVEGENYLEWKKDLNVWELFTDLDVNKRGLAVYKTLRGLFRDCVSDLTLAHIHSNDGLKKIVEKLDKVFLKDKDTLTFIAFETFYNSRRASSENMIDYLVHFEHLYHKMEIQEIVLPQGILAFLLLKASNVSSENERLARATCPSMTYENMKACIIKIFGDPSSDNGEKSAPSVKYDPMFDIELEDVQQSNISFQVLTKSETDVDYNSDSSEEEYRPNLEFDKSDSTSNSNSSDEEYSPKLKFGKSNSKLKIRKHNQTLIKDKKFKDNSVQCNTCGKMCKDKEHYDLHLKNYHNEMLCESCPRYFKGNLSLKVHINLVHKTNYTCKICEKRFKNYADMRSHNKLFHISKKKESICDICGKVILSESLKYHMKTHLSTEVHYCDQCDFHSNTKKNISKHWLNKHSNLARLKCKICGKDYKNVDSCRRHMKDFHSSTSPDKPFICTICDKAFKRSQHLKRHEMLHSGEKPFGCTLCDFRTNQHSNLTVHMKSHKNQLPEENLHI